jgi:dephospho-CoA kinase
LIFGLTGRIATGKTAVAAILKELGAAIINADEIAKELARPDSEVLTEVVREFGTAYVKSDGTLDRKKLGENVFSDAEALQRLNHIFHPPLKREISARIETTHRQSPTLPIVVEAAVLFEMEADSLVDKVIVTDCSRETQLKRLIERGLSPEEAEARVTSQKPAEEFLRRADMVINTEGSLEDTRSQVLGIWRMLG